MGHSFITTGGGKGANQAVAAARLGGTVSLVAKIGADAFGTMSAANFREEGIIVSQLYTAAEAPSGVAVIVVDDHGENVIVVAPGANALLSAADILQSEPVIKNAGIVLLQLEIPMDTVAAAVKLARMHNRVILLNPAPAAVIPDEILRSIDIITPNESEAGTLTGITVSGFDTAQQACDKLHEKGIPVVIITMGSKGAYLSSDEHRGLIAGFSHVKAVDTVAAGDTFCGALAIAITEKKDLPGAVKFANAAAALSVTKAGAQASIPRRDAVEELLLYKV
jgi:ribokinase